MRLQVLLHSRRTMVALAVLGGACVSGAVGIAMTGGDARFIETRIDEVRVLAPRVLEVKYLAGPGGACGADNGVEVREQTGVVVLAATVAYHFEDGNESVACLAIGTRITRVVTLQHDLAGRPVKDALSGADLQPGGGGGGGASAGA